MTELSCAVRQAAEQRGHETPDMLDARLATLELRPIKWAIGTGVAAVGLVITFLRIVG